VLDGTQAFGLGVLLSAAAAAPTPAAFAGTIAASLGDWLAASSFRAGCPVAALSMSVPPEHPLHARCAHIYGTWTAQLARDLEGHGVPAARAPVLASTVLNLFEGALLEARLRQSRAPLDAAADVVVALLPALQPQR
jgi:TetR/AcrR family transcriptional repressor of lmrAB and yxaGH operons